MSSPGADVIFCGCSQNKDLGACTCAEAPAAASGRDLRRICVKSSKEAGADSASIHSYMYNNLSRTCAQPHLAVFSVKSLKLSSTQPGILLKASHNFLTSLVISSRLIAISVLLLRNYLKTTQRRFIYAPPYNFFWIMIP